MLIEVLGSGSSAQRYGSNSSCRREQKERLGIAFAEEWAILKLAMKINLKSEVLVLVFGMLIIMITFGDSWVHSSVGN
jgi:hypothetical protein